MKFTQQGTPQITAQLLPQNGMTVIKVTQACPHPRTGKPQKPFLIPFSYELLNEDGTVALAKVSCVLSEETHTYEIPLEGSFIPVFMHGSGACNPQL